MTDPDIRVLYVARPGPPGVGVSGSDWTIIRGDVDALLADVYRGMPRQEGTALELEIDANSVGGNYIGGVNPQVVSLNAAVPHRIIAQGRARVTVAAGKTVTMAVALSGFGLVGPEKTTASEAGTYTLKFYAEWERPAGPVAFQVLAYYETSDATNATFHEVEIDMTVTPRTD